MGRGNSLPYLFLMLITETLEKILKKQNSRLFIYSKDSKYGSEFPAGIMLRCRGTDNQSICACPKGIIPERTIKNENDDSIKYRGWRDIVDILVGRGLVDKRKILELIDKATSGIYIS